MATARWEPFRDLAALQDRVNRIFEDVITRPRRGAEQEDLAAGQWSPSVDIFETPESIVIRVEVPGIEQQDLDVEIKENSLIVRVTANLRKVEARNYHRVERAYGTLPSRVLVTHAGPAGSDPGGAEKWCAGDHAAEGGEGEAQAGPGRSSLRTGPSSRLVHLTRAGET